MELESIGSYILLTDGIIASIIVSSTARNSYLRLGTIRSASAVNLGRKGLLVAGLIVLSKSASTESSYLPPYYNNQ